LLLACTDPPPCPNDMVLIEGGRFELGEASPRPGHKALVVEKRSVVLDDFCIASHPFPGKDLRWPSDGLSRSMLPAFEAQVKARGRRACTVEELMLASAGPENRPLAAPRSACETRDDEPKPIGSHPECRTPTGIYDFGVRSSWAHLGPLDFPRYEGWASWGPTWRDDTFYPPTNFAVHSHDGAEAAYLDDGWRTCADLGADEGEWPAFAQAFPGSFADLLDSP